MFILPCFSLLKLAWQQLFYSLTFFMFYIHFNNSLFYSNKSILYITLFSSLIFNFVYKLFYSTIFFLNPFIFQYIIWYYFVFSDDLITLILIMPTFSFLCDSLVYISTDKKDINLFFIPLCIPVFDCTYLSYIAITIFINLTLSCTNNHFVLSIS